MVAPELENLPTVPPGTDHIWAWFRDLDSRRQAGMSVCALSWSDIHAYFQMRRVKPSQWELEALSKLDDAYLLSRIDGKIGTVSGAKSLKGRMTGTAAT